MKERRRNLRMTIMGMVRVWLPGEPNFVEGYLANISRGGIGIYLGKKTRTGQKLRIAVLLKGQEGQEEEFEAKVAWTSRAGALYMVGVQFEKMTEDKYHAVLTSLFP
ncbi:MAG TPA: PilZ domain-containing protein [Nitrospiria bacterium]|nr:PilZ domain-containing protein [Nitrospiria bacterium]